MCVIESIHNVFLQNNAILHTNGTVRTWRIRHLYKAFCVKDGAYGRRRNTNLWRPDRASNSAYFQYLHAASVGFILHYHYYYWSKRQYLYTMYILFFLIQNCIFVNRYRINYIARPLRPSSFYTFMSQAIKAWRNAWSTEL